MAQKYNKRQSTKSKQISGEVEWGDVQGILYRGYKTHKNSMSIILKITDQQKAGIWLAGLEIASALDIIDLENYEKSLLRTLSFTHSGLGALGLGRKVLDQFSLEFQEGMAPLPGKGQCTTRRSGMLGDSENSSPTNWLWGGYKFVGKADEREAKITNEFHILLNLYAKTKADLDSEYKNLMSTDNGVELSVVNSNIPTHLRTDNCEQFGYRDGISQPVIEGMSAWKNMNENDKNLHRIAPGELLLGYSNERGMQTKAPKFKSGKSEAGATEPFEFGKNGSYLVVRQLQQNVEDFHKMLEANAKKIRNYETIQTGKNWIAARMMGRQFSGEPIAHASEKFKTPPTPKMLTTNDEGEGKYQDGPFSTAAKERYASDYYYLTDDKDGLTCPLTSHTRRAFPRDTLISNPELALKIAKRHRILRRGRLYGVNPISPETEGNGKNGTTSDNNCGLFFMAFNADIAEQFEMIQHSWLNNRHSGYQYDEVDPVAGQGKKETRRFTVQQRPANIKLDQMSEFITVRGGGYFFMPGKSALRKLAEIAIGENDTQSEANN